MSRSRSYCFTLHTDEAKEIKFPDNVRYAIYQYELTPTTNKLHAQGYMQINTPLSVKSASKILPGAHLEIAKGTLEDNIKYCSKTDTRLPGSNPYIFGEPLKQGQRTDLNKIHDLIKSGLTPNQIAAECPSEFVKYSTGIRKLYDALLDVPRKFKTEVIWLCGPTGSGKSQYAWGKAPDAYEKSNNKWWDGYNHEETIIMDDLDTTVFPVKELLKLFDRYPYRLEIKGSSCQFNSKRIYVTHKDRPEFAFQSHPDKEEILRRIEKIVEFEVTPSEFAESPEYDDVFSDEEKSD